jgi:diamine N-acetyltransferase
MAEPRAGERVDLVAHGRDGATEAIGAWADSRLAAGEAAVDRDPRPAPEATVELREVTADTVRAVCLLHVAPDQRGFVAPNAVSFAEAMFEPKAWFRAVVADDVPVGFVMLSIDEAAPEYYLWRFMIDQRYQGRGYGRAAILQVIEHVRALPNATELLVSWVPEPGGPAPFYEGLGFEPTGEIDGDEVVARLRL